MGFHLGLVGIRRPCAAALFSNPTFVPKHVRRSPPADARPHFPFALLLRQDLVAALVSCRD